MPKAPVKKEVDFTKQWSNSHKCLTASEAAALKEIMRREVYTAEHFQKHSDIMVFPRNPVTGEPTPRLDDGFRVMNPNEKRVLGRTVGGVPVINPFRSENPYVEKPSPLGKIGVREEAYNILGNTEANLAAAQPVDLHELARELKFRQTAKGNATAELRVCKDRAFALRRQKDLERDMLLLRNTLDMRQQELDYLKQTTSS